ncbi:hypothetical protein OsJ_16669 [Oryza sativa Japonica Group]|uniref:Uncharacterized protein n=1 Tax=Oryza sativa subsp. japonica TaxID=39947 RepID=A3AYR8_ORYSJ|nr:hypothetical protein OsJ_16669 [Oryza sativa Japonica Group]
MRRKNRTEHSISEQRKKETELGGGMLRLEVQPDGSKVAVPVKKPLRKDQLVRLNKYDDLEEFAEDEVAAADEVVAAAPADDAGAAADDEGAAPAAGAAADDAGAAP